MKFDNIRVMNFENALRGMRNPKESYNRIDSEYGFETLEHINLRNYTENNKYKILHTSNGYCEFVSIGPNDMKLAQTLIKAGPEHRKFLRQISVSVDITAPLYWWKEFDTYKVGTVANSTSTMHKITSKPITLDSFETDDFHPLVCVDEEIGSYINLASVSDYTIQTLENLRLAYLSISEKLKETDKYSNEQMIKMRNNAKEIWKELIRWLPTSWLQTRTVTMNYENLLAMCSKSQRRFHKLTEWSGDNNYIPESFIKFARLLPYAQEFIFIDEE